MPTYAQDQAKRTAYYTLIGYFTGLLLVGSVALALLLPAPPAPVTSPCVVSR